MDWWQQTFPEGRKSLTIADASGETVSIAYGEKGSGQPLFLLHGIGSWSYNWRFSVEPLSRHFRVICVDAKGYGFSQVPSHPEIVGHQMIELERIIRALSDRPVILVGESLGALTALGVTQSCPELVDRLVLLNIPIFPKQLPNWGMRLLSELPLEWVEFVDRAGWVRPFAPIVQAITRFVREEVVVDPNSITDEEIYWLTYPYLTFPGKIHHFASDLQLAAIEIDRHLQNKPNLITTLQQNLPNVSCPTLILWSDQDRWFPVQDGEQLRDRLPNAQLQILANCGHNASGGNPEAVNSAILNFTKPQSLIPNP